MLLASTAAMTISFFPALSAMNGFGRRTGDDVGGDGKAHGNMRWAKDCWIVGGARGTGGSEVGLSMTLRRSRGNGGGSSGVTSNRAVNS